MAADAAAARADEIEALHAIFGEDELEVLDPESQSIPQRQWPAEGSTYRMAITPAEDGEGGLEGADEVAMELLFAHTRSYPDEPPCLKLRSTLGLSDAEVERCYRMLLQQVEENKGMAMIYTLVTAAKEWLRDRAAHSKGESPEEAKRREAAEDEAKRAAIRAMGTMVTPENFKQWKARFDAEAKAAKAKALEGLQDTDKARRMSGKQWFMQEKVQAAREQQGGEEDVGSSDDEYYEFHEAREGGEREGGFRQFRSGEEEDVNFSDDDDEGMLEALEIGRGVSEGS